MTAADMGSRGATRDRSGDDPPVRLLWTGGWDSTFRLLDLLLVRRLRVQPYYIIDPHRSSLPYEIRAMVTIRRAIFERYPEARQLLSPTIYKERFDIEPNAAITAAHKRLAARYHFGSQYEWLSGFVSESGASPMEMAIHGVEGPDKFLENAVEAGCDESGPFFRLKNPPLNPDLLILEDFRFPLLDKTKRQMEEIARLHGFADLLELTWFCHRPRPDSSPCGTCYPCIVTRREGMGRRIPLKSHVRWRLEGVIGRIGFTRGAGRLLKRVTRPRR